MEDAKNIAKNYNPAEFEDKLYNEWVEKGYFHAEVDKKQETFYNRYPTSKCNRSTSYGTRT